MAKITNKSQLVVGTELVIDEPNRTITLVAAGNLSAKDGVTLQALYSKLVDLWSTEEYQDSPFPMYAIDALSGQFQFGTDGATFSGWKPVSDVTRQMLRDGGWSEFNGAGALARQYVGIVGLGTVSTGSQLYYQTTPTGTADDFTFDDQANEGIQVFGSATADATTTTFDTRSYFKGFVREQGKSYRDSVLGDTGKTATGAFIVNLLLSNEDDLKIQAPDIDMASAPYAGITIDYFTDNQTRTIGGAGFGFKTIINGNGATLEQVYTKVQFLLRQSGDINDAGTAGVKPGKVQNALLAFAGDTLITSTSVFIDGVLDADSNRVEFTDDTGVRRLNPFTSAGVINSNAPLIGSGSSFRLMYTTAPGTDDDYGQAGAVTVNDASGQPITGSIASGAISFTYDYDGNTQAGFAAGTDRAVTLIGIRPGTGKFVSATGVLTRSKSISLSLVAEQDRVYA